MRPSELAEALELLVKAHQPVFIWAGPGVGKSMIGGQVADKLFGGKVVDLQDAKKAKVAVKKATEKIKAPVEQPKHVQVFDLDRYRYFRDIRALLLDPVDLRGVPYINGDNRSHWCPPDFLPNEGAGLIFLDELNAAPPLVQAACYQLVLDRRVGEYRLPDGWSIIAAGNRETDRAVTHRMSSALASRFVHIELEIDLNDWVKWALENDIMTELIAFLRFRPALLYAFDPQKNEKAFPCPRTWEFVSRMLSAGISPAMEFEIVKGAVGEGAAAELVGFLKICRDLPNPDVILMSPDKAKIPEDPATLYALCGAIAQKATCQSADRLMKVVSKLPAEFGVLLVRDSLQKNSGIANTRAFIEWAAKNSEVLL